MWDHFEGLRLFRHNSVFVRLLLVMNLIVILCIVSLGVIVCRYCENGIAQVVSESNLSLTNQVKKDVERELDDLETLSFHLALDQSIRSAVRNSRQDGYGQILNMEAISSIRNFKASSRQSSDIWVELFYTDTILTDSAQYDKNFYFDQVLKCTESLSLEKAKRQHPRFLCGGVQTISRDGVAGESISFVRTVPVDSIIPSGAVGLWLDLSQLQDVLDNVGETSYTSYCILDADGVSLASSSSAVFAGDDLNRLWDDTPSGEEGYYFSQLQSGKHLVTYSFSEKYGWTFLAVSPVEAISGASRAIRHVTTTVVLIVIAVGLVCSYLLAVRLYHPINRMVVFLSSYMQDTRSEESFRSRNELTFISSMLDCVYEQNGSLIRLYRSSLPKLYDEFFNSLVSGRMLPGQAEDRRRELNLEFPFPLYLACIFEIDAEHLSGVRNPEGAVNRMVLEKYTRFFCRVFRRSARIFAAIFNVPEDPKAMEELRSAIQDVQQKISELCGGIVSVGIGESCHEMTELEFSFMDAAAALKYCEVQGVGSIIHIDEVKDLPKRMPIYSLDTEIRLSNLVKTCDFEKQRETVEVVFRQNYEEQRTDPAHLQNLCYAMIGTALRTVEEIHIEISSVFGEKANLYQELDQKSGIIEKQEYILYIFAEISRFIERSRKSQNEKLMARVDKIIRETNGMASLMDISSQVGLSYTYLSSVFKEISGENFADYINKFRIETAKRLLLESGMSISEIAAAAGYASSNTFIKSFKRYVGITPGRYRDVSEKE